MSRADIPQWIQKDIYDQLAEKAFSTLPDPYTFPNDRIHIPVCLADILGLKHRADSVEITDITFKKCLVNGFLIWERVE